MTAGRKLDPHKVFTEFATLIAKYTGSPWAFLLAAAAVVVSLVLFGVEITNIGISIVTLLMVFVIQNTQNRDSFGTHAKLDELVVETSGARNELAHIEDKTEGEINEARVDVGDEAAHHLR